MMFDSVENTLSASKYAAEVNFTSILAYFKIGPLFGVKI